MYFLRDRNNLVFVVKVAVYFAIAGLVVLWVVPNYVIPRLYGPNSTAIAGWYMQLATPLFLTSIPMALLFLLLWHVYTDVTDPLSLAVREYTVRRLIEEKRFEPIIKRLSDREIQRIMEPLVVKPPTTWLIANRVRRVTARVRFRRNTIMQ